MYLVKEVADMVGISVRMLHHYDKIGLLIPESLSSAGYRLYSDKNLERLQQILFFKELDFSLQEIKDILDSPQFDRKTALISHKKMLLERKKRLEKIIKSVDLTIDSIEGGVKMSSKDMFEGFDMSFIEKHKDKYREEVKEKYGHTDAYKESINRTNTYTKDDWAKIVSEGNEIYKIIAENMDKGPKDIEVQNAVNNFRNHISKYFYECTIEIYRGLGELYVNDERFTKSIDKNREGLAEFLREAINVYCDKEEK